MVNFGNVACRQTSTVVMHIRNDSDVPTVFQVHVAMIFSYKTPLFSLSLFLSLSHTHSHTLSLPQTLLHGHTLYLHKQLQLDKCSVFQCDIPSGELGAHASQTVAIRFKPHRPIPYCRRVVCLVQNQVLYTSSHLNVGMLYE